ncbi:hypothetical protein E1091_18870 [Micromonospora fluostatini]|uniref:Uncharacterized protein n=1 Tax=Micromonospora fluostatini TaxID=1629071 RepID=A0ABY2DF61_9ACTN|nr:hypothetical protein E1091_18870 [Micromonospora fluostatini]
MSEQWRKHKPVWGDPLPGEEFRDRSVRSCTGCSWQPQAELCSIHTFGEHLVPLGAPDYMTHYWQTWATHVEAPTGQLDRDAVARELSDFSVVMEGASTVYSELADLSKPNTAPGWILAGAERKYREIHANLILCDLLSEFDDEPSRQRVIDYAETLHEGAWAEHQQGLEILRRVEQEQAASQT